MSGRRKNVASGVVGSLAMLGVAAVGAYGIFKALTPESKRTIATSQRRPAPVTHSRRKKWISLTAHPDYSMDKLKHLYYDLRIREPPLVVKGAFEGIERDVPRTMPQHPYFKIGGIKAGQLKRVLQAYALHDPEVGYAQGMNFIAAVLLVNMPEDEAFALLVRLMYMPKYNLRNMFKDGLPLIDVSDKVLTALTRAYLPALSKILDDSGFTPMHIVDWRLTLFCNVLPYESVVQAWEVFMIDGWPGMYRVCIALLRHASNVVQEAFLQASRGEVEGAGSSAPDGAWGVLTWIKRKAHDFHPLQQLRDTLSGHGSGGGGGGGSRGTDSDDSWVVVSPGGGTEEDVASRGSREGQPEEPDSPGPASPAPARNMNTDLYSHPPPPAAPRLELSWIIMTLKSYKNAPEAGPVRLHHDMSTLDAQAADSLPTEGQASASASNYSASTAAPKAQMAAEEGAVVLPPRELGELNRELKVLGITDEVVEAEVKRVTGLNEKKQHKPPHDN